ncbi:MAG: DMT family transporter [Alphaproteobacteria bacterium]
MKIQHILLAVLVPLILGLNFVATKYALTALPAFFFLGLRSGIVALALLPFYRKMPAPFLKVCQMAVIWILMNYSLRYMALAGGLDVSLAVIGAQMKIPFVIVLSSLLLHKKVESRTNIGIILSLIGMIILVGSKHAIVHHQEMMMILISAFCFAVFTVELKKNNFKNPVALMVWSAFLAAPFLFVLSYFFETGQMAGVQTLGMTEVALLAGGATLLVILAQGLWYFLAEYYTPKHVTHCRVLTVIFAIAGATYFLGEPIDRETIIAAVFILGGVAFINMKREIL